MKKRSQLLKTAEVFALILIAVVGIKIDIYAITSAITCKHALCSNKVEIIGQYKYNSAISSSVPVYGGKTPADIDSAMNDSAYHYSVAYCSSFNTNISTKKAHTMTFIKSYHAYTTETNEYMPVCAGDSLLKKTRATNGLASNSFRYNPETKKYDILIETASKDDEYTYHFRKYKCNGSIYASTVNKSTSDALNSNDFKDSLTALGGCGCEEYLLEHHYPENTYLGHIRTAGCFLYKGSDGIQYDTELKDLIYDSTNKQYTLPHTDYSFDEKDLPKDDDTLSTKIVYCTDSTGKTVGVSFCHKRNFCAREQECTDCGWSRIVNVSSGSTGSITSYNETTHHKQSVCNDCKEILLDEDEAHSFSYGAYSVIVLADGTSTQHQVIRTCSGTYGNDKCGYTDTITENHIDNNHDGFCDKCNYAMKVFSVTVPTAMNIAMDRNGKVYTADNVKIINNSTETVEVKSIEIASNNNWNVVSYSTDMSSKKVNSKKVGFKIRDSVSNGTDLMKMQGDWSIEKGKSLSLPYDAVVSATSSPVTDEHILTLTFIVDWSDN